MIGILKESLWNQFGASIDTLKNAVVECPDEYWDNNKKLFYITYHTLIFLDYYSTVPAGEISSPLPFTITEPADIPEGALDDLAPDRIYTKAELLGYLEGNREKCRRLISALTDEKLAERWIEKDGGKNYPVIEILLYNMRHVQHHAAQLNMLLRQGVDAAPKWVRRAKAE